MIMHPIRRNPFFRLALLGTFQILQNLIWSAYSLRTGEIGISVLLQNRMKEFCIDFAAVAVFSASVSLIKLIPNHKNN